MSKAMIRAALPPDAPRVLPLVEAAFAVWVPRLGRKPAPMEDDYEHWTSMAKQLAGDPVPQASLRTVSDEGHA